MDWVSPENVIAVLTALLGVVVTFAVLLIERRVPRRKRIGYRVQLDTPVGDRVTRIFNGRGDMTGATLVLLRIENDGGVSIGREDYNQENHGLTVRFARRKVEAAAASQAPFDSDALGVTQGVGHSEITLPKVPLNRGDFFKVLVLLTGGEPKDEITVTGPIRDGGVHVNHSATFDDKPPTFSRAARRVTIALTACVITLAAIIVIRDDVPPPIGCARGTLTVIGSTAFEPVLEDVAEQYEHDCAGATVNVDARGSTAGIRRLAEQGPQQGKDGRPELVALSDGPKPDGYPQLKDSPVAVSLFTLVVNDRVELDNLTLENIRALYRGDITNWRTLGGPDLPVRLVSRDANSGTREVFQRRVLGRNEPANSSRNCSAKDDPEALVIRCELDGTAQVLSTVASLPGALGYTELRTGSHPEGLHRIAVDGRRPDVGELGSSPYPYREIEYAYTWNLPAPGSLTSSFLVYLGRGGGQDVILGHGHLPCATPKGLRICGEG
ncbi:substrate-binding domain-containing protein [Streptomyces sp. NPDC048623]|uniref:PstS family phosphate ABC transporter substrate-binding protein n=1 Tax=Streptomyces sp. NPDC048623 TaxID=3155761 RepID=UPI003434037D